MPWTMLRELKRFFAEKGLTLMSVSEQKVRAAMKEAAALYETGTYRHANARDVARKSAVKLEKELEPIEQRILSSLGPVCTSIEVLMKSLNITRQSFHGGSFNGNDCHRILLNRRLFA